MENCEHNFRWEKYLGTWYEQYHIPMWFDYTEGTDISAEYRLIGEGVISVKNSVTVNGKGIAVFGNAKILAPALLSVSFEEHMTEEPNYLIEAILKNKEGEYVASIVTNPEHSSLFVLTREKHISVHMEALLLDKVRENFSLEKVLRVKHI